MKPSFTFASGRIPAVILACLLFAACSTTQKGSTGTGTQEAAPISESAQTQSGATSESGPDAASAAQSPSEAETAPGPTTESPAGTPQAGDEEAKRLQEELAQQEAEINRIREEQVKAQQLAEEEAAKQRAEESAAAVPGGASGESASQPAPQAPAATSESTAAPEETAAAPSTDTQDQPAADLPLTRSIYFEFDDATIADEYDSIIIAHAAFLKAHPDFKAEVQGNCDERGSREYNIALGARRAEAVKRGLELAGADGSRIKTVSFGAEKPVAFGKDEESYRQNRRADIVY